MPWSFIARRRSAAARFTLALGVTGSVACTNSSEDPIVEETDGALGQGRFRWSCVEPSDPTCGTGVFPYQVAIDARFGLGFLPGSGLPDEVAFYEVSPVSRRHAEAYGDETFHMLAEGPITMLATGDGYGVDYVVLRARPVESIRVTRVHGPETTEDEVVQDTDLECEPWECDPEPMGSRRPSLFLRVDETVQFQAVAEYGSYRLAGALDYEWRSLTPEQIELSSGSNHRATFRGLAPGIARIEVSTGGVAHVVEFPVYPPLPPPPEPPPPDPETSSTGTDGGSTDGTDGSGTDGSGDSGDTDGSSSGSETGGSSTGGMQ